MLRYEIAITNTPVAADSEILESFTTEPHTTADPLLTKSYVLIRVAKCMFGGCSRAPGNNTMYYYRLHGCIFGGCKMYCYGLHPTLGVVLLTVVICINTRCKCIFTGCKLYYYRLHWCFCVDACNFQEKEQERERERERDSFLYGSYCSGWHPTIRFVVQAVAECMGHELPSKVPVPHWPPTVSGVFR